MGAKWQRVLHQRHRQLPISDPAKILPAPKYQQFHTAAEHVRLPQITQRALQEYILPPQLPEGQKVLAA